VKLVVPYLGELRPADTRLIRLAEFLGIECEPVSLAKPARRLLTCDAGPAGDRFCVVINPDVIGEWMDGAIPSPEVTSSLLSQFRWVLVHAVRPDPLHSALIAALTAGRFRAVQEAQNAGVAGFRVGSDSRDICEAFAGLSIGVPHPANDHTFVDGAAEGSRKLITLGGDAYFAAVRLEHTEVFLLGSEDVVDLDAVANDGWLSESFSRFVPHAMALRHIFGERCWRPVQSHACVIIDDPLLRATYGFLAFEKLLQLMERHNFRTTIAFIPHNFRRSSPRIVRFFREHADRLSLCFHGNDHTGAEFAATDAALLNTMLETAERRISAHSRMTGLTCDPVMVFPQGAFSVEAMASLRSHNFDAAVNTVPHPHQQPVQLTVGELARPAVLRHAGFPLFLRRSSQQTQDADIAFRLFFGIPILIVEHHGAFENPQDVIDAVVRINRAAPGICWSSAGAAVRGSVLRRRDTSGNLLVKAYAGTVQAHNPSPVPERTLIEWSYPGHSFAIEGVHRNGVPSTAFAVDESRVRISAVLGPGASEVFSIRYRKTNEPLAPVSVSYSARAVVRRRLSEIRDNYISKSPSLLAAVRTLQRRVQH
jgi:hypothetical protein